MAELSLGPILQAIPSLFDFLTQGKLAQLLERLIEQFDLFAQLRERVGYRGMYEILDYDSTLEIKDAQGLEACVKRRETIRFLQDNVVAIHDHAWGEGEICAEYHCQPGTPVDFYQDGSKHNILISLRETKHRGDVMELEVERVVRNGLTKEEEWLETEIDHRTLRLSLSVIFPLTRHCQRATITRRSTNRTVELGRSCFDFLADGRQRLTWATDRPKLNDCYTLKWIW
jgi:hypothetical protein